VCVCDACVRSSRVYRTSYDIIITVCCAAVYPSAATVQAGDGAGLKINHHISSIQGERADGAARVPAMAMTGEEG